MEMTPGDYGIHLKATDPDKLRDLPPEKLADYYRYFSELRFEGGLEARVQAAAARMEQIQREIVVDFCKHGAMDIAEPTLHIPKAAEVFAYFAGRCYRALYGTPTLLMFAFELRHAMENPTLILPEVVKPLADLSNIYDPALVSRQQFLDDAREILGSALRNYPV